MSLTVSAPKSRGPATPDATTPANLARISELEHEVGHLKRAVKFIQDTNSLIVIVLFVAVIGVLFAISIAGISALNSDNASRNDLTKSVRDLTQQLNTSKK